MPYLQQVPIDEAEGAVREAYDRDLADHGYVCNYTLAFSLRPEVLTIWGTLIRTIRGDMDLRRYELATVAAAAALRSRYCVAAHTAVLESKFYSREQIEQIARDFRAAGLDPADVAVMSFAEKVALHAHRITQEDIDGLRACGLSDREIFNVALTAAARSFFSKTLDAAGAQPDDAYASTVPLLDLFPAPQGS
jgi:uncharacterized peroxidase-related enzyme